jgi:hypothetical protein
MAQPLARPALNSSDLRTLIKSLPSGHPLSTRLSHHLNRLEGNYIFAQNFEENENNPPSEQNNSDEYRFENNLMSEQEAMDYLFKSLHK